MDNTMMQKMPQTTLLIGKTVGAAAIGCGGFFTRSNGWQGLGVLGAGHGGFAVISHPAQRMRIATEAPLFAIVDGIGVPTRRRLKS